MKVCIFSVNVYSLFNSKSFASIGGTEVQLFAIASFLADELDFQISVITGDWGQAGVEQYGKIILFRSFSIKRTVLNHLQAPYLLWRMLRRVDADVYIASSAGAEIGIVAFFCKIHGKKFVYRTAHQIDCDGTYKKNNGIYGRLFGYGLRHADIVVSQNEEHQAMLLRGGITSSVIRNAFVLNSGNSEKIKNNILWIARCETWKNPQLFLDLAQRFPSENFKMIAPKQGRQESLFKKIEENATLLPNLDFIESVPFFEIQKYFDEAKIFVGTSDYEGFPNTYIQACIGKTPVVSYSVNPDGFITKNNIGYCAEGNFERMIEQVEKLLKDKEDWSEKSENALCYVKKYHDMKIIGKQWSGVLRDL